MENRWGKTRKMKERLERGGALERRGGEDYYQGRRIIHRDSEIDGGVYLGQGEREAIVVDSENSQEIQRLYQRVKERAAFRGEVKAGGRVLRAVFEVVREAMPRQSERAVQKLLRQHNIGPDQNISLDVFLRMGVGVCRHDALACGVLIELAKRDGYLKGKVSVDRNFSYRGGHAWARYAHSGGYISVLDVALGYCGPLKDADAKKRWAYERPEDF